MATYTMEFDGLKLSVEIDFATGQVTVTCDEGYANINAFYWSNGDDDGDFGGFSRKDSSLNMNGTDVEWDGAMKLSSPGLGKTPPDTYLTEGESYSFLLPLPLDEADFQTIGIRATSTSTPEGSIKGVAQEDPPGGGGEEPVSYDGLSQGYWSTHEESWDGYAPTDSYEETFGLDEGGTKSWDPPGPQGPWGDPTLLQATNFNGGDEYKLGREATAALLNSSSGAYDEDNNPDGDLIHPYRFTEAEIIQAVQTVYGLNDADLSNDNIYNSELGAQLAAVLEFWNNARHDESTPDPTPLNTDDDDVASLILAGQKPNENTDADSDPGLTGTGIMYTGTLVEVLDELYPDSGWA